MKYLAMSFRILFGTFDWNDDWADLPLKSLRSPFSLVRLNLNNGSELSRSILGQPFFRGAFRMNFQRRTDSWRLACLCLALGLPISAGIRFFFWV